MTSLFCPNKRCAYKLITLGDSSTQLPARKHSSFPSFLPRKMTWPAARLIGTSWYLCQTKKELLKNSRKWTPSQSFEHRWVGKKWKRPSLLVWEIMKLSEASSVRDPLRRGKKGGRTIWEQVQKKKEKGRRKRGGGRGGEMRTAWRRRGLGH